MLAWIRKRVARAPSEDGQSAWEFAMTIPVFVTMFALMYQLYSVAINAQYVHVKSRAKLYKQVKNHGCKSSHPQDTSPLRDEMTASSQIQQEMSMFGPGMETIEMESVIVCGN